MGNYIHTCTIHIRIQRLVTYVCVIFFTILCGVSVNGAAPETWPIFAVTTSTQCAEGLPIGNCTTPLTSSLTSAFICTDNFRDARHTAFYQRLYVSGTLRYNIIYQFGNEKTLSERFTDAAAEGEPVEWIITTPFDNITYYVNGTWWYSDGLPRYPTVGQRLYFAVDDGIWGKYDNIISYIVLPPYNSREE